MAKKKHKTPKHLDYLFKRTVVTKDNYADFWEGYWGEKRSRDRQRYVNNFVLEFDKLSNQDLDEEKHSGTITKSIKAAREQAREIGGYVVRRNAQGRFSRTGRHYQAIRRRKNRKAE